MSESLPATPAWTLNCEDWWVPQSRVTKFQFQKWSSDTLTRALDLQLGWKSSDNLAEIWVSNQQQQQRGSYSPLGHKQEGRNKTKDQIIHKKTRPSVCASWYKHIDKEETIQNVDMRAEDFYNNIGTTNGLPTDEPSEQVWSRTNHICARFIFLPVRWGVFFADLLCRRFSLIKPIVCFRADQYDISCLREER